MVNWCPAKSGLPELRWFYGFVNHVSFDSVIDVWKARLFIHGDTSGDNDVDWMLTRATHLVNPAAVDHVNVVDNLETAAIAWTVSAQKPVHGGDLNDCNGVFIRNLTRDETIAVIKKVHPNTKFCVDLKSLPHDQLAHIVNATRVPKKYTRSKTEVKAPRATEAPKAPKAPRAPKAPEAPEAPRAPKAQEAPRAPKAPKAPKVGAKTSGGLAALMNAEMGGLKRKFESLNTKFVTLQHDVATLKKERHDTRMRGALDAKTAILNPLELVEKISSSGGLYALIDEGIRKGNKNFVGRNTRRCMQYLRVKGGDIVCKSKMLDAITSKYYSAKAEHVPLAIMEVDPDMRKFAMERGKDASIVDLRLAHDIWLKYSTCAKCVASIPLEFVVSGAYVNSSSYADMVWLNCALCMTRAPATSEAIAGCIVVCGACKGQVAAHGGQAGGDDRTLVMRPISTRFPWLTFSWGANRQAFFKKAQFGGGLENTVQGPDTFFKESVLEKGIVAWVALEEDGNSHDSYDQEAEYKRMRACMDALLEKGSGDFVFMIRYVPTGPFNNALGDSKNPEKALRLLIVRQWVTWFISQLVVGGGVSLAKRTVLYLFYNYQHAHIAKARKAVRRSEFEVGETCTYPQETIGDSDGGDNDNLFDWRYCLHPNEGALMNALGALGMVHKMTIEAAFD